LGKKAKTSRNIILLHQIIPEITKIIRTNSFKAGKNTPALILKKY
jgi:hypothetical protein